MLVESVNLMDLKVGGDFDVCFDDEDFVKLYSHSPHSLDVFIITQLTIKHCEKDRYEASFIYVNDTGADAELFHGSVNGFNRYKIVDNVIHMYSWDCSLLTNQT